MTNSLVVAAVVMGRAVYSRGQKSAEGRIYGEVKFVLRLKDKPRQNGGETVLKVLENFSDISKVRLKEEAYSHSQLIYPQAQEWQMAQKHSGL